MLRACIDGIGGLGPPSVIEGNVDGGYRELAQNEMERIAT